MGFFLIVAHFVCPLVFFTNFTRNPYQTQINLFNVTLTVYLVAAVIRYFLASSRSKGPKGETSPDILPGRFIFLPLLVFALVLVASSVVSYFVHPPFFRSAIISEGLRAHTFLLVNVMGALLVGFGLGASIKPKDSEKKLFDLDMPALWGGLFFAISWLPYHQLALSDPPAAADSVFDFLWDPYGFAVWALAVLFFMFRRRRSGVRLIVTLNFLVGLLASVYGIGQYFGWDAVWPHALNPYGARAISTFGNPNFLSSYLAILFPLAVTGFLVSAKFKDKLMYGLFCLIYEAGLLVTLTRSSWLGAFAGALAVVIVLKSYWSEIRFKRIASILVLAAAILFFAWPEGAGGSTPTPLRRALEAQKTFAAGAKEVTYSASFQRYLIWSTIWKFTQENPLLGKGWGTLELFFPFYQGELLYQERFRSQRTHANNAHNEIFELLSQAGVLGLGAFLWFLTTLGVWLWRNIKTIASKESRFFAIGLAAGTLAMLVDNLLNITLHITIPAYLFWSNVGLLIALVSAGMPVKVIQEKKRDVTRARRLALGLAVLLCVFIGYEITRRNIGQWLSEFYYFRGFSLHRGGKFDLALDRLLKSYHYFPMEVNKNYELGNVYARLGDRSKALWAYDEALRANAGYDEIFFNKAGMLLNEGRYGEAMASYRVSLAINPLNRSAYAALISILLRDTPRYGELAITMLARGLYFFPTDLDFLNNLGSLYTAKKEYLKASEYFLKALAVNPGYGFARNNLNLVVHSLLRARDLPGAKTVVSACRAIDPSIPPIK